MKLIYNVLYIFFLVIEVILLAYLFTLFFPADNWLRKKTTEIVNPLLEPIRYLLRYSVFKSNVVDFSPIISFIFVGFLQQFFYKML